MLHAIPQVPSSLRAFTLFLTCPFAAEMSLDFSGYFEATEQAFAQEKEDMLYKVDGLGKMWTDNLALDEEAKAKSRELQELKNILTKQNLQLLRCREEALQMRLKNATLGFQVRQLQAEIFRLLPYSQTYVPSTEYHMSLDQSLYRERAPTLKIEADPEHAEDLARLRQAWEDLTSLQSQVFEEERKKHEEDSEEWGRFVKAFMTQNQDAHQMIDGQLGDITRKLVFLKSQHEEMISSKKDTLNSLKRKLQRLKQRLQLLGQKQTEKQVEERSKARNDASKQCGIVRGRVREIERKNLAKFSTMKKVDNELQARELSLLRETDTLTEKIDLLTRKNEGLSIEGNARIAKLEDELNAVISAMAAIQDCSADEEERILGQVAGAVGRHGASVKTAEQINMEIQNLAERLQMVSERFRCV